MALTSGLEEEDLTPYLYNFAQSLILYGMTVTSVSQKKEIQNLVKEYDYFIDTIELNLDNDGRSKEAVEALKLSVLDLKDFFEKSEDE